MTRPHTFLRVGVDSCQLPKIRKPGRDMNGEWIWGILEDALTKAFIVARLTKMELRRLAFYLYRRSKIYIRVSRGSLWK